MANAQLAQEGFEGTWTSGQGPTGWKILQNTIGTTTIWQQSPAGNTIIVPFEGTYAAYLDRQNVTTGIPEDYLITPEFNVPVNAELRFFSRLTQALDQGGIYKVKILPQGSDSDDINNYVDLQTWTELQINPAQTSYNEIVVAIPSQYLNTQVRIAFVMAGDNADRWLVDNVKVTSVCDAPSNLTASNLTVTSANLSWDSPSGVTEWEVEYVDANLSPTGIGNVYNGSLPYAINNLTASTNYKYYVRSKCADGGISQWQGPYFFKSGNYGDTCEAPLVITTLPYSQPNDTANFANNYSTNPNGSCIQPDGDYLSGNDIVYSYTPTQTGIITITTSNTTANYGGMFVYTSCADIGVNCYAKDIYSFEQDGLQIANMNVTANTTYYIVISSLYAPSIGYNLEIQEENCIKPSGLAVSGITTTTATLSWTENGTATAWEYKTELAGEGLPSGNGTLVNNGTPLTAAINLPEASFMEVYVRSVCGDGTYSSWFGPVKFTTLCSTVALPLAEGFNTDSTQEFCWAINNNNNDISKWTTDDWSNYYEGNQSASFARQYEDTGNNDDFLISPRVALTGNQVLKFNYRNPDSKPLSMSVLLSTTGIDPEDFTTVLSSATTYYFSDGYVEKTINLSSVSGLAYIAFHIENTVPGALISIDNVRIQDNLPCPEPTDLKVVNTTPNTASLSWTPGNTETAWQVIVQSPTLAAPGASQSGDAVSALPYIKTGLLPNTEYVYYVRSMCGGVNGNSNWTGPFNFKTPCEAFDVPFFEGFNSGSNQDCWQILNINNDFNQWGNYSGGFEGDGSVGMYATTTDNDWLISPAINLTGNQRLKYNFIGPNGFKVLLSTTGRQPEDFVNVLQPKQLQPNNAYLEKKVSLSAFTGPVYIAWVIDADPNASGTINIDNIIVEDHPQCSEPVDITVGAITPHTAELQWTIGMNETNWEVLVQPVGGPLPTDTSVGEPATNNIHVKTGLDSNTSYEYYVRSDCGANGKSIWVGPYKFTTTCDPFDIPYLETFNSDSDNQACWLVLNEDGFYSWNMNYFSNQSYEGDEHAHFETSDAVNNDWLISPAINLTGNQRLKYYQKAVGTSGYKVLLSTTGRNPQDFTEVLTPATDYNNAAYVKRIVSLAAYTGTVYIAWQVDTAYDYGSSIFIDKVLFEDMPVCPEPTELTANVTGQTSAELAWTPNGTETQWEVVVQLSGTGEPTEPGVLVSSIPYTVTETADGNPLQSGTGYEFYVKAVCDATHSSIWSDKQKFITVLSNDNCDSAINVPVNGTSCEVFATGTVKGATASPQAAPCFGLTDDDVWFEFTATSTLHTITLNNVDGSEGTLMFALYSGGCNDLTQVGDCVAVVTGTPTVKTGIFRELTVGQTYKIRVFTPYTDLPQNTTFNVCVKTPVAPISINTTTYTVDQLVSDVLINSECDQISNITWSTGSNFGDTNGIGYFEQNGSDFPFESGIIMSTGNAAKGIGPNYGITNGGGYSWPGDLDLSTIINQGTANASIIEFDFVPAAAKMSFDFIFASEEYGFYQCEFSDAFAFILTDSQGVEKNLAVVPGTEIPISVTTVRDMAYNDDCDSQNSQYFDNYTTDEVLEDTSPISYDGVLKVLTAAATVVPDTQYHIKMVIADRQDIRLDSAVFLRAGSFNIGKPELGEDLLVDSNNAVCAGGSYTLATTLDPVKYEFEWKLNGTVIDGQTGANLIVTAPGNYAVKATLIGSVCFTEADIVVEFYPAIGDLTGNPVQLTQCDPAGFAEFNLGQNTTVILDGTVAGVYTVTYHLTAADAAAGTGALPLLYTNTTAAEQTIYVRIVNTVNGCYGIKNFKIVVQDLTPQFTLLDAVSVCEDGTVTLDITPGNYNPADVTYSWTHGGTPLAETTEDITVSEAGIYEVTVNNNGCTATKTVTVTVVAPPVADKPDDVQACTEYKLPALTDGNNYFTGPNGTGTPLFADSLITTTQVIFIQAKNSTNCTSESSFKVTINPLPEFNLGGPYVACENASVTITVIAQNFDAATATYNWTLNGNPISGNSSSIETSGFGIYEATVTVKGCSSLQTVEVVKDNKAIDLAFEEGCNNNEYKLKVIPVNGSFDPDTAHYSWTGPNGFVSSEMEITVPVAGSYIVKVITAEGCEGEDFDDVKGTYCDIPKGISPNGDGSNDNFDLSTLDVKKVEIFNRYGQEVYSQTNYTNQWHGQNDNGSELPTGTYYYMIEGNNGESKTGWVYINRQD